MLTGIRMEATESTTTVLDYYEELLKEDPTHVAAWKRQISVLRRVGHIDKAVEELNELLDTFYLDTEGWLELADMYSSSNQYDLHLWSASSIDLFLSRYKYALQALSHAVLLAPQNPFAFLQFAETAYTSGDLPLALKMFLVVVEMYDGEDPQPIPEGISIRAWWGVKLVRAFFFCFLIAVGGVLRTLNSAHDCSSHPPRTARRPKLRFPRI